MNATAHQRHTERWALLLYCQPHAHRRRRRRVLCQARCTPARATTWREGVVVHHTLGTFDNTTVVGVLEYEDPNPFGSSSAAPNLIGDTSANHQYLRQKNQPWKELGQLHVGMPCRIGRKATGTVSVWFELVPRCGPAVAAFPNLGKIRRRAHQIFFWRKSSVFFRLTRHADGRTYACPHLTKHVLDANAPQLLVYCTRTPPPLTTILR